MMASTFISTKLLPMLSYHHLARRKCYKLSNTCCESNVPPHLCIGIPRSCAIALCSSHHRFLKSTHIGCPACVCCIDGPEFSGTIATTFAMPNDSPWMFTFGALGFFPSLATTHCHGFAQSPVKWLDVISSRGVALHRSSWTILLYRHLSSCRQLVPFSR